jgi:hypothetical protein
MRIIAAWGEKPNVDMRARICEGTVVLEMETRNLELKL